jgi:hypothetical protein
VLAPSKLGLFSGGVPVGLALGETSTCLLLQDQVLCWGGGFDGIEPVASGGEGVTAGSFHQCVLCVLRSSDLEEAM